MATPSVTPFGLGREVKAQVVCEITFDSFKKPVADESFRALSYSAQPSQERVNRIDARPNRGMVERISRIKLVEWNVETYILPRADDSAGNTSDIDGLLIGAMGSLNAGTDTFSLLDGSSLPTLSAIFSLEDFMQDAMSGMWVNEFGLTAASGDEPKFTFSGGAATHIHTSSHRTGNVTSGTYALIKTDPVGTNDIALEAGDAKNFEINSWVKTVTAAGVDVDTDRLVTAVNTTTDVITVDGVALAAVTAGGSVRTFNTFDITKTGGTPATMIDGVLSYNDGTGAVTTTSNNIIVSAFDFTLNNNIKPLDNIAFRDKVSGVIAGFREITGSITLHGRQDNFRRLADRKFFDNTIELILTLGDSVTTGSLFYEIKFPQIEISGDSTLEVPEASSTDESTITLNWQALASTLALADEFTIVRKTA